MESERLYYLLEQFYNKNSSAAEKEELLSYIEDSKYEAAIKQFIGQRIAFTDKEVLMPEKAAEATLAAVFSLAAPDETARNKAKSRRLLPVQWMAVAACFCLAIAGIAYFTIHTTRQNTPDYAADLAPGTNKALLTLADGTVVPLESNGNKMFQQGQTKAQQTGGSLVYQIQNENAPVSTNHLSTPRGGQFQVQLSDGTHVWLNAASSLTYPTAFTGKERLVEITGEAYFDIAPNKQQPFRIRINGKAEVEVLGTGFNINAYEDEAAIQTTLLQGSIKIHAGKDAVLLKPGQQIAVDPNTLAASINTNADISQAVAWKNGAFSFRNADLKTVMRQLSRWYNVDVTFEGGVPSGTFNGEIGRALTLSQVLEGLAESKIKYRIINNRIIIHP